MSLPQHFRDFFNRAAPSPFVTPLSELQGRYEDKVRQNRALNALPAPNLHGIDYIVEMRVREWMMRMQREEEEARRIRDSSNGPDKNGPEGPPVPPRPGNKISPPKP